ncbi:MAG: acetamidase/formamidase family protein [Caldilineaceae bacterium]|nr:acetamidase/formamidase family protein [Caldilineaceae bacterium]
MATRHFQPTHYFTTIGSHEPVLRIADGDTVVTTTVDARGADSSGSVITARGNPMTGPFYVEGAEPGDTLAVTLDKLRPNRLRGWTRKMVASNVVDPEYVRHLPWPVDDSQALATWEVDNAAGTATLVEPSDTKVGRLTLPLAPMVGCFGVAPAGGEAISTATSGPHGGNMDYRGFREGVTVYFPVAMPGALFHIGDGHALQGDGEIVGTGIEISFEVQFTVRVRKGKAIGWPRGEDADYIFTCGNARPLDQCVQHATTEMIRWLESDYGLDPVGAQILMGQTVEYDLGNIYDPAYTMVCKMPKRVLR